MTRAPGVSPRLFVRVRLLAAGIPVAIAGAMALATISHRNHRRPPSDSPFIGLSVATKQPNLLEWLRLRYCELVRFEDQLVCDDS